MPSALIGALRVNLGLNSAEFEKGANRSIRKMNQIERAGFATGRAIRGLAGLAGTLGLALAGAFSSQAIKGALDYAASLGEVSTAAGVTVEELQVYRQLATQVNISTEQMDKSLTRLTLSLGKASLGSKAEADALAGLNIQLKDGEGHVRATGDVMLDLADQISKIEDPAKQAAAAYALFGKQGQRLLPLLNMGRKGLEEFAKQAKDSGTIIGTDLSNAADRASDKMALLNAQLRARFSKIVAENSNAILTFANALSVAVVKIGQFIARYGKLLTVLGGAAIGARFGGLPGAVAGAGAGIIGGNMLGRAADDNNSDLNFRIAEVNKAVQVRQQFLDAKPGSLFKLRRGSQDGGTLESATAEVRRQTDLLRKATAEARAAKVLAATGTFDPDEFLDTSGGGGGKGGGGKGKSGPTAEEIAQKAAEDAARFEDELGRIRVEQLQAQTEIGASLLQRRDVALAAINEDLASFERNLALRDDLTETQRQELLERQRALATQQRANVEREHELATASEQADLAEGALKIQLNEAQVRSDLADNARDKLAAELAIFDLMERLRIAELDRVLAIEAHGTAAWENAHAEREALDASRSARRTVTERDNATPAQRYRDSLNLSAGQMNDAIDQIKINGLNALNDGLVDAIVNFKSLGDVAKSILAQILADLIRLQLQKLLFGTLSNLIGLGGGGGGGGAHSLGGGLSGAFAGGTNFAPGGYALVGERGPEIVNLPRGSQVIPNDRIGSMGGQTIFNVTVTGGGTDRENRATGRQIGSAAAQEQARARRFGIVG